MQSSFGEPGAEEPPRNLLGSRTKNLTSPRLQTWLESHEARVCARSTLQIICMQHKNAGLHRRQSEAEAKEAHSSGGVDYCGEHLRALRRAFASASDFGIFSTKDSLLVAERAPSTGRLSIWSGQADEHFLSCSYQLAIPYVHSSRTVYDCHSPSLQYLSPKLMKRVLRVIEGMLANAARDAQMRPAKMRRAKFRMARSKAFLDRRRGDVRRGSWLLASAYVMRTRCEATRCRLKLSRGSSSDVCGQSVFATDSPSSLAVRSLVSFSDFVP